MDDSDSYGLAILRMAARSPVASPEQQQPADHQQPPLSLHPSSASPHAPSSLPGDARQPVPSSSRAASPKVPARMSRPMTPQGMLASEIDGGQMLGPAVPRSPDSNRPLNVTDALSYLDAVKTQFRDKPDVYNHFLDIMKDFKSQVIDTPGVIERVSMLFHGNLYLIQGFNTFLPPGYRIELSTDPRNMDTITVTTPLGTMTQNISAYGAPMRMSRETILSGPGPITPFGQPPHFALPPPPVLPVGIGNGSRPATPSRIHSHGGDFFSPSVMFSSPPAGSQATAAASFLGTLANRTPEGVPAGEFNHAIQFLNKIKVRFENEPDTYRQFLEILQSYQKEHKHLQDSQVYAQVQMLFKDAPDLMAEFGAFLPEALAPSSQHTGLVGILPHPTGGPSAWGQGEASTAISDKAAKAPNRRRKRATEKDVSGAQKSATGRAAKRTKPNQKPEPQSPKFAPYPAPPSPLSVLAHPAQVTAVLQHQQVDHPHVLNPHNIAQTGNGAAITTPDELLFFDRTKKALESGGTYEEFLKLLNLFARDVIDTKTLIDKAEIFLGEGELMTQFKELLGWDDKLGNVDFGPPGSIRTGPPDPYAAKVPDDGQGPSYRRLPATEVKLACSGRRELEWSVLNNEWVSHPTWASEDSGFVAHKKNSFEESLFRCEEERHEYQVHIEALSRTINVLEGLESRIDEMSPEDRAHFRLKPSLGGTCPAVYERIIKKIYGRDNVAEIMRALQESPSVAVPVVLKRLKQKDEEWRRAQREWSKTWREIDVKNFYKALDHQGIVFKANDKKNITAKHFVQDIESVKSAQTKARDTEGETSWARGSVGHQLEYKFEDTGVLQDSLKLIFSFLDHSPSQYSPPERRSIERFLRSFIPVLFMFPAHEFNAGCGPLEPGHEDDIEDLAGPDVADDTNKSGRDRGGRRQPSGGQSTGVSAGDLRRRLLKTAQERSPRNRPKALSSKSAALTRSASPAPSDSPSTSAKAKGSRLNQELHVSDDDVVNTDDIWIQEAVPESDIPAGETPITRRSFFANTTFYTLLRLLQLLYSRLLMCKEIGAKLAAEKHASLLANRVAVQLGLDEPSGPAAILSQAVEAVGDSHSGEEPNVLYLYLLDSCEKVFDNELDQATYEEHMRWFFGTKAYHVFTLDKVITAIVKQVQTIMADNKCQELWYLLQRTRGEDTLTAHDAIRYRREAERHVGSDDNLYRFDWESQSKRLLVQLVGVTDPSVEQDRTAHGRWREYVATYVTEHPTEWVPDEGWKRGTLFLKRNMMDTAEKGEGVEGTQGMRVCVRAETYQLVYAAGTEDCVWRRRGAAAEALLRGRAGARAEERRRGLWRRGWAGVGGSVL